MPSASHRSTAHPSSSDQGLRTRRGKDTSKDMDQPCPNSSRDAFEQLLTCRLSLRTRFDEEPSKSYPRPRCHFGDAAFLFWNYKLTRTVARLALKPALKWQARQQSNLQAWRKLRRHALNGSTTLVSGSWSSGWSEGD
jgi:hypothetical protein